MSETTVQPLPVTSPLVERLVTTNGIQQFASGTQEDFAGAIRALGYESVFDIIREPREVFARKLREVWKEASQQLAGRAYDNALCYAAQASLVYRQQRISRGRDGAPYADHRTGLRSLVEVGPSYPKQFGEDWDNFCRSGSLEAVDSPVAYLVDILRFAQVLEKHGDENKLTLSQRRPDIFAAGDASSDGLLIDQANTFEPIPALSLANEVVSARISQYLESLPVGERPAASVEAWFASLRFPFLFPYAVGPEQVRLGLDRPLGELLYRGDLLPTPFSTVTHEVPANGVGYAPIAWADLSRERQDVLLEVPDVGTPAAIKAYVSSHYGLVIDTDDAAELQLVRTFLEQTGVDGDGLDELLARGKFQPVVSPNYSPTAKAGVGQLASSVDYGAIYVNNDGSDGGPLALSEPISTTDPAPLRLQGTTVQRFIRLNKMTRMRQWLGIRFADLDALVTAAQRAEAISGESTLTQNALRVLGAYRHFSRTRGIDAESFAALFADMAPYSASGKLSLFDGTFNHPPLLDSAFVIDDQPFSGDIGDADALSQRTMLQLCGGLGMSPDEREYGRAVTYVKAAIGPDLLRSLPVVSGFHRLARGARMFGLSVGDYLDVLEMLGGESAARMAASGSLVEGSATVALSYSEPTMHCLVGEPVKPNVARLVGITSPTFSVSPTLPAGLNLDTATGQLTGTPVAALADHAYTVTAAGAEGSATAALHVQVDADWQDSVALTGSMNVARDGHAAVLIKKGGKPYVLVTGGGPDPSASAELYDPVSRSWTSVSSMRFERKQHTATLLPSGKVLVAGGFYSATTAELYSPDDDTWTDVASMHYRRAEHSAVLLMGRVYLFGGQYDAAHEGDTEGEYFDEATGVWTKTSPLGHAFISGQATANFSGTKAYVTGGFDARGTALDLAYNYDAATDKWTALPAMPSPAGGHAAVIFSPGQYPAVFGGGRSPTEPGNFQWSAYSGGEWHEHGWLYKPRIGAQAVAHDAARGQFLLIGGASTAIERLSALSQDIGSTGRLSGRLLTARTGATVTVLDDANRSVLVAGGKDAEGNYLASAELVTIDPAWEASTRHDEHALSRAAPSTGDALDLLLRVDWIVDWLKASKQTVAQLAAVFGATQASVEDGAAIEEMARRIHQGLPATCLTDESMAALDLPGDDDEGDPIVWDRILEKVYDLTTGLVIEPKVTLGTPAEWKIHETITAAIVPLALDSDRKIAIAASLADVIGAARRAQCGLLEAELSHVSGLSPDQVVLALIWSGTTPQDALTPLLDTELPTTAWLESVARFKRHARALTETKLSSVALHTFLAQPTWFAVGEAGSDALTLSLPTYYLMHRYRAWLNATAGGEDEAIRYLAVANTKPTGESEDDFKQRCADRLAPLLGWIAGDVLSATARLPGGVATGFSQIEWLLRLGSVAEEAGVPIRCALQLGTLNVTSDADAWAGAGSQVQSAATARAGAAGTPEMDAQLGESLRDALVTLYLTAVLPKDSTLIAQDLAHRIVTPNDLYEYLLLDTQVSQQVQTSRVASAIASVQQYINGILIGMEPGYASWQPAPGEGEEWELVEWRDQKSQYPLWAANQQLRHFPELYIDPTLRLGKSIYFEELEQTINQNRIHIDTVRRAVLTYLGKFEEVANLTIINGYASTDDFANATYYFVGKSRGKSKYYWRKLDMSQRPAPVGSDVKGDTLNPSAWSDWKVIDLPVSDATIESTIRPVFFNERLYVTWVDWYATGLPAGETPVADTSVLPPQIRMSAIFKEYDDSWSAPQIYIDKAVKADMKKEDFHTIAFHDTHVLPKKMMIGVYAGANPSENGSADEEAGHHDTYAMMWNARLDHSFNVEMAWPATGVVNVIGGEITADERYVRLACRQFALRRDDRYIQFPITGTTIRIRAINDASGSPWNYSGHNGAIEGISSHATYESSVDEAGKRTGYVVVTCRLKESVSAYKVHHAIWEFRSDKGVLRLEAMHKSWPAVYEGSSSFSGYETGVAGFTSISWPGMPQYENSWGSDQVETTGVFVGGTTYSLVGRHVVGNGVPAGYGSITSSRGTLVFDQRPSLNYQYGAKNTFKLWICYAPNELISEVDAEPPVMDCLVAWPDNAVGSLPAGSEIVYKIPVGDGLFPTQDDWVHTTSGFQVAYGIMVHNQEGTIAVGDDLKFSTIWLEDFKERMPIAPKLGTAINNTMGTAEFIDFRDSSIKFSDGSDKDKRPSIRMNTLFAKDLISRANVALENLLSWETQSLPEPAIPDGPSAATMDFKGANGKYFWELFFHLPFSIAHRFHTEQQFADSDKWLQFIFDPTYKGEPPGENLAGSVRRPYWLVRPLDWINDPEPELSEALRAPLDPDGQASAFPVSYRKAVYFLFIRNIMLRGDWAYRDLTPDSLNEAKLWYVRALDLLGPRPDAMLSDRWKPALLKDIVVSKNEPLRELAEAMGDPGLGKPASWNVALPPLQWQPFRRDTFLRADDTDPRYFRIPFNRRLVELWDQLESRLSNLRHNRTIDGKPLQLPIFAPPLDPSALLARFAAGGTSRSAGRLGLTVIPHYRYQTMFTRASAAIETLIQFGQTLQSVIERKEQAELSELQQGQLWEFSQFAIDLQKQMQDVEAANENVLLANKRVLEGRKQYYEDRLKNGGVSSEEVSAAALSMTARAMEGGAGTAMAVACALKAMLNIVGMAAGGQDIEGPPEGIAKAVLTSASVIHGAAESLDRAATIKRRNEEWTLQRDQAALELAQLDEQLKVMAAQRMSTTTQLRQAEVAREQAEQMYTFLSKRFSNSSLYGWLVSQLSTFYYQAYDTTLSLCLAAEACWQFEIGDFSVRFIEPGKWKDAYRGLTVGEGLKLNLLKMDAAYANRHERLLMIGKTISVKALYEQTHGATWETQWNSDKEKGEFSFELSEDAFNADYANHTLRRIRRVGVSIPAVVGAYQDIRAVLTQTSNVFAAPGGASTSNVRASQQIVVSRGVDDDGMMMDPQIPDDRYLPFEGTGAVSSWNLTFPNAKTDPQQEALMESLNDVILHLTYSARLDGGVSRPVLRLPQGRIGR